MSVNDLKQEIKSLFTFKYMNDVDYVLGVFEIKGPLFFYKISPTIHTTQHEV